MQQNVIETRPDVQYDRNLVKSPETVLAIVAVGSLLSAVDHVDASGQGCSCCPCPTAQGVRRGIQTKQLPRLRLWRSALFLPDGKLFAVIGKSVFDAQSHSHSVAFEKGAQLYERLRTRAYFKEFQVVGHIGGAKNSRRCRRRGGRLWAFFA